MPQEQDRPSSDIKWIGRTRWPVLGFVVAVAVLHAWSWYARPGWFPWQYVDYAWLFTAAMGLLLAVAKSSQMVASYAVAGVEARLEGVENLLETDLSSILRMYESLRTSAAYDSTNMTAAADWIRGLMDESKAESTTPDQLSDAIAAGQDRWDPPYLAETKQRLHRQVSLRQQLRDDYQKLSKMASGTESDNISVVVYPWILAPVLALRITKVSAVLWGLVPAAT